jgi:hypothetical protein
MRRSHHQEKEIVMGEINLVVTRMGPNNEPVLALIQNHVVIYIPASDEAIKLAEGMINLVQQVTTPRDRSGIEIVKS